MQRDCGDGGSCTPTVGHGAIRLQRFLTHDKRENNNVPVHPPMCGSCQSCGREYCMCCGNAPHEQDCLEAYVQKQLLVESELKEWHMYAGTSWLKRSEWRISREKPMNRRVCPVPKCHASAEKNLGCNHVHCATCDTHFCWVCVNYTVSSGHPSKSRHSTT